jgi:hypothetical protein
MELLIVPSPTSFRRLLPALVGLIVMLTTGAGVAHAEFGELSSSPVDLTGKVSESPQKPHVFGVDPTDDSFYVGDEVTKIEGPNELHFYRVQKFSSSGTQLAEIQIKAKEASVELGDAALEGLAVDAADKRVYLLVSRLREPEEEEPVFDSALPAAATLYAFSTEVKNSEHKLEAAEDTKNAEGLLTELHSEAKEPRVALLNPHGISVDPTNGEVVILGQEDLQTTAGGEPELRAAVQRVHSAGAIGSRYIDITNCLDEGNTSGGEQECGTTGEPFSPIVVPGTGEGKVYVERSREIWGIPSSTTEFKPATKSKAEPKSFETEPKRIVPTEANEELGSEQALLEFPKAGEVLAEEVGGSMIFVPGQERIYLTGAATINITKGTATNAGVLILGYAEHSGKAEAKEIGWTGGEAESSGEKCSLPKKGNPELLIGGGEKEDVFVFDARGSGSVGVNVFGFGPDGAGCPHAEATAPSVKVKNNSGQEVEVSPVPLGEAVTLSSTLTEGNAESVKWKFKDLTSGEEEPVEEAGYEFETTTLKHKFERVGKYEVSETIETDNLASPAIEVKREVVVGTTPIAVEFSHPATATVGKPIRFEAVVNDPHETGTPHLKYVWVFGDGQEKSGETTSTNFAEEHTYTAESTPSVTLKVTDGHGIGGEVTETISVSGEPGGGGGGGGNTGGSTSNNNSGGNNQGGGSVANGKAPESTPEASIASNSVSVASSGMVALKVSCPAGDSSCSGTVTLRTNGAVAARAAGRHKGKHKKTVLTLCLRRGVRCLRANTRCGCRRRSPPTIRRVGVIRRKPRSRYE